MARKSKVVPHNKSGYYKTGSLNNITAEEINQVLGFKPNVDDAPDKVVHSWGFKAKGKVCGIWDYRGSHLRGSFSTYGPGNIFMDLFPGKYSD